MTDLEKRAEEYLKTKWGTSEMLILGGDARKVLADFAQSETDRLSKHILDLQKTNGALTDRVRELEQQIEEMKICQNCKFEDNAYLEKPCCDCTRCLGNIKRNGDSDKWEIKEK